MMATVTVEERLARIEGGYEHMATRADIAELRGEVTGKIDGLSRELRIHRWVLGVIVATQLLMLGRVFEIIPPG